VNIFVEYALRGAENERHENDGQGKLRDWKMMVDVSGSGK